MGPTVAPICHPDLDPNALLTTGGSLGGTGGDASLLETSKVGICAGGPSGPRGVQTDWSVGSFADSVLFSSPTEQPRVPTTECGEPDLLPPEDDSDGSQVSKWRTGFGSSTAPIAEMAARQVSRTATDPSDAGLPRSEWSSKVMI